MLKTEIAKGKLIALDIGIFCIGDRKVWDDGDKCMHVL